MSYFIFLAGAGWLTMAIFSFLELRLILDELSKTMQTDEYQEYTPETKKTITDRVKDIWVAMLFCLIFLLFWWILLLGKYYFGRALSKP